MADEEVRQSSSSSRSLDSDDGNPEKHDLEAQNLLGNDLGRTMDVGSEDKSGYEYGVSARLKLLCLAIYLGLNMGLTLHSKSVLELTRCPWLLTTLHATFSSVGCAITYALGYFRLMRLSKKENMILVAFSFLFTINIAISVVSLSLVSVPLHQTVRASTPSFTVFASRLLYGRQFAFWTQISLLPIVLGVCTATYGDISFTKAGILLTFLGLVPSSTRDSATNVAFGCNSIINIALLAGEWQVINQIALQGGISRSLILALACNGCIALLLNITSFQTNKLAGALTLKVCANVKQCATIVLGILVFDVRINFVNGFGMALTTAGAAWFSSVELKAKRASDIPVRTEIDDDKEVPRR